MFFIISVNEPTLITCRTCDISSSRTALLFIARCFWTRVFVRSYARGTRDTPPFRTLRQLVGRAPRKLRARDFTLARFYFDAGRSCSFSLSLSLSLSLSFLSLLTIYSLRCRCCAKNTRVAISQPRFGRCKFRNVLDKILSPFFLNTFLAACRMMMMIMNFSFKWTFVHLDFLLWKDEFVLNFLQTRVSISWH